MAMIKSGEGNSLLTIDAASKAARTSEYYSDGSPVKKKPTGAYSLPLVLLPTVTTAGAVVFSFQNTGTKKAYINRINLTLNFTGTAAASRSVFEFIKFTGAAPVGGSDVTVIKRDSTDATPTVSVARNAPAGATTTGTTFESNALHTVSLPSQLSVNTYHDLQLDNPIVLNPGEGLAIRNGTAIVAGAGVAGGIFWYEAD